jgi:hypothetical protein
MAEPSVRGDTVVLTIDNEPSAVRVRKYTDEFTALIQRVAGGPCPVVIEVRGDATQPTSKGATRQVGKADAVKANATSARDQDDRDQDNDDQFVDVEEIKTLPTVTNTTIADQLTDLFPGSELIPEDE